MTVSWRKTAAAVIVAAGAVFIVTAYAVGLTGANAASRDYIGYWAAGRQLIRHANPYDVPAVLRLEQAAGLGQQEMKVTPSPPPGLILVLLLGLFDPRHGLIFWLFVQLAALSLSLWILRCLLGQPSPRLHLFGYLFAPAIACLMAGQLGIFFLLGVTLFLWLHATHPFLAGLALLPCALKPHLFLPVAVVLVLWSFVRRTPHVLAGFVLAVAAGSAIVQAFNPRIWAQFFTMTHTAALRDRFAPTFSANLRLYLAPHAVWLQYVPLAAACLWAGWYFWTRRAGWNWLLHGQLVLLVALLCAPYAWFTDEAVLLPAVLVAFERVLAAGRSPWPLAVIAAAALAELLAGTPITAWYFLWTTPAWFLWFLYATHTNRRQPAVPSA